MMTTQALPSRSTHPNTMSLNASDVSSCATEEKIRPFDVQSDQYIETPFTIIESYFEGQQLSRFVRHQLESYNHFVNHQISKTIDMFNPVHVASEQDYDPETNKYSLEVFVTFENFSIYRPQIHENNGAIKLMFPQEARLRNFTYAASTTVDLNIKYVVRTGERLENTRVVQKTLPRVHLGKLPIMLRSDICVLSQYKHFDHQQTGECKFDAGGYFIINGSEKTVLAQERAAENRVYCYNVEKNEPKYLWKAEIKSVPDFKCISPKQVTLYLVSKKDKTSKKEKKGKKDKKSATAGDDEKDKDEEKKPSASSLVAEEEKEKSGGGSDFSGFGHPIVVAIPRVKQPIPLFILFRALGVLTDQEICEKILLNLRDEKNKLLLEALQASVVDANHCMTYDECVKHITDNVMYTPINMDKETGALKKREFALEVLNTDLFPHCQTMQQKIYFLGYMANKLLLSKFHLLKQDDRDAFWNKRVDATGTSLNNLYRNLFNKAVKEMEKQIVREINTGSWRSTDDVKNIINLTNVYKIVKSSLLENGLKRALSTGDFGVKHSNNSSKVGVAQVYDRLNYQSSLSHARRLSTPTDKSGKLVAPRKLHNSSWGFVCPAETPEGQSVGVVKNLSCLTHMTIASNSLPLYEYILPDIIQIGDPTLTSVSMHGKVKVFINGAWVGISERPVELYHSLKEKKYKGILNVYTSIVFDYKLLEIRVCNDGGRLTRPLLRVKDNHLTLTYNVLDKLKRKECTWDQLMMEEGVLEYIDPEEQSWAMIATKPKDLVDPSNALVHYTHCEIHPSTIFGVLASCIPFPEHNQSPRNTYQCAQGKQAMGVYVTNYENRMDKTAYILNYPMRPLVETRIMDLIRLNQIPSGSQLIVAIMTHTGYNQEDSLLVNKGSVDRGMAMVTVYHTKKDEDKQKVNGDEEIRCKPDPTKTKGMKMGNYSKVNSKGVIPVNELVENRDMIITKVVPIKENRNDPSKVIKYEDQSKIYKTSEETFVDKNYIDRNGDGYNFAKVRLRAVRKPNIGDKFSSRHGQKGTVGNIIQECDMPFTEDGLRPDIIVNPHAIPSRMTIGHLKETILGELLVELGLFGDGTAFTDFDVQTICDLLLKAGHEAYGNKLLYDPMTGEQVGSCVFMGPVFYQRLKHMVVDKAHSRSIGPMVNFTRQPAEGRCRDGGHRFGEMERDCMISHGASRFTRERMYDASDKYQVHVCRKCGLIASYNDVMHIHLCHTCGNRTDFAYVEIPYACKLLFQELNTMNIAPRLLTEG